MGLGLVLLLEAGPLPRRSRTLPAAPPTPRTTAPPGAPPPGAVLVSLGARRNDRRPPRRVRREHPVKAQRVKTWGRNQQRQLLDELQRIQQQVRGAVGSRMRQLEHHLPARALRQPLQRPRRGRPPLAHRLLRSLLLGAPLRGHLPPGARGGV